MLIWQAAELCVQVSAYASFGRMNGNGAVVDKHRQRMDPNTKEPLFTNCTRDFTGTLDYIFYTGEAVYFKWLYVGIEIWMSNFLSEVSMLR